MKKAHVMFDNVIYFAPTGLGKHEYITILTNKKVTDNDDIKLLNDYIIYTQSNQEDFDFIKNNLATLENYCKKISAYLDMEIVDNAYEKIPSVCFLLLSVKSLNDIYSFKTQFKLAVKEMIPNLLLNLKENSFFTEPKESTKIPIEMKLIKNDDIEFLKKSIAIKENDIGLARNKINQLKNESTKEDLSVKLQEIEKETQNLILRRTECEIEMENVISKLTNVTAEEKKELYKRNKELVVEINQLTEKISNQDHVGTVFKKAHLFDSNNSEIIKLESIIRGLEDEIEEYENEISRISYDDKVISSTSGLNQTTKKIIKTHQKRAIIDSQYISLPYNFEITNVNYMTKSKSDYRSIYAVIFNILTRGRNISFRHKNDKIDNDQIEKIYQLQLLILMLIRNGMLDDNKWSFEIEQEFIPLLETAIEDLLLWVEQLTSLTRILFLKPQVECSNSGHIHILFDNYSIEENTFCINITQTTSEVIPVWIENRIDYIINPKKQNHRMIMEQILQTLFGFSAYREGQLEIIANFLMNKNTLGILTTGGGKSLTYYISVLLQPKISLIIAPINSLIKDQTDNLSKRYGIDRFAILTGDNKNRNEDLNRFKKAHTLFTFASPERVQNIRFREILIDHSYSRTIGSVILDEVHCLSEWGHDFRVPYLMLSTTLNTYCEGVCYLGLTATASVNVVRDLMIELNIKENDVIYSTNLKRENLKFTIKRFDNAQQAILKLKNTLKENYRKNTSLDIFKYNDKVNSIIVFSRTKGGSTGVEALYRDFSADFVEHVGMYHGERKEEQDAFMSDERPLLFATKAFGMGIDKPNVRATIHFGMPESREAYYQEAGRAGRDGTNAECMLLSYTNTQYDMLINRFFNSSTTTDEQQLIMKRLQGTDISTNFFFYLEGVESLDEEVKKSLELINRFHDHDNYIYTISTDSKNKIEKYLYILHKMGIVKNWEVAFNGLTNINFKIEVNPFFQDIDHIKKSSLFYIHAYSEQFSSEDTELERDKFYRQKIDMVNRIEDVNVIITAIREWYYFTFTTTRRIKLENMYRLISDESNHDKIQDVLETAFDISQTIGKTNEGYTLSFESNTLGEVMGFAFQLEESKIDNRIIAVEHLLESLTSNKVRLYLSILLLRANKSNAAEIITDIYSSFNQDEKLTFIYSIGENYQTLNLQHRLELFNILDSIDKKGLKVLCKSIDMDEVVYMYVTNQLLDSLRKGW